VDRRTFFELLFAFIVTALTPVDGKAKAVGTTVRVALRPGICTVIPEIIAISAPSVEVESINVTLLDDIGPPKFIQGYSELVIDAYYSPKMAGTLDALNRGKRPTAHIELPGVGAWRVKLTGHAGVDYPAEIGAPPRVRLFAAPDENGFIPKGRAV
jgi:hypothetical protein